MSLNIKVGGSWKKAIPKVKVSGTWRDVKQAYVKVSGEWKELLSLKWDITTATYDNKKVAIIDPDISHSIRFNLSGDKLFMIGFSYSAQKSYIYQYNLSTPWDVSSYTSYNVFNINDSTTQIKNDEYFDGLEIKQAIGGSKAFFVSSKEKTYKFDMDYNENISTSTFSSYKKVYSGNTSDVDCIRFYKNGEKFFIKPTGNNKDLNTYDTTPYSVNATTYANSFSTNTNQFGFSDDGTKYYEISGFSDISQYSLTTPWDLTTATFDKKINSIAGGVLASFTFKPDGSKLYVCDGQSYVKQYSLKT